RELVARRASARVRRALGDVRRRVVGPMVAVEQRHLESRGALHLLHRVDLEATAGWKGLGAVLRAGRRAVVASARAPVRNRGARAEAVASAMDLDPLSYVVGFVIARHALGV